MAVWSEVLRSNINEIDRFDAEYYKPEYITINHILDKIKAERINPYLEFVNCGPFGSTIKNETYTSDGVIVARPFNINSCVFELDNLVFIREEDCKRKNLTLYKDRDVFFARVGDIRVGILSSFYLSRKVTISPNIIATRFKNKNIYPEYVVIFFNTVLGHKQIEQALKVVAQPTISTEIIRKLRLFVPSLNRQEEISRIFNKSLELKQLSQSLYTQAQKLLECELGLDNLSSKCFSNIFGASFNELMESRRLDSEYYNPKVKSIVKTISAYKNTKVKDNFLIKNGFPWHSKKFLDNNSGEPVVRIRDIKPTYIDNEELTSIDPSYCKTINFTKSHTGNIAIGMDGLKYFYASIIEEPCYINQRVCQLIPKSESIISPEYLTFIINSSVGQSQLLRDMTIATTVGHITNKNIANLLIPIVSNDFHDNITKLVRKSIDAKKESKNLLEQAKHRVEELIEQEVEN